MRQLVACLLVLLFLIGGCSPREPLRIGFLGGLSGNVADLGEAGRNGAQIAIEEANRAGGINGRQLAEAILRDYPQMRIVLMSGYTDETAEDAASELPILAKPFAAQDLARALQKTNRDKP